jgi:hypothetical protein
MRRVLIRCLRAVALRKATNTTFPGYLSHEAVVFNPYSRKWIFLPRKVHVWSLSHIQLKNCVVRIVSQASTITPYDDDTDERMVCSCSFGSHAQLDCLAQGTNLLLVVDEDFSHIDVRRVGPLEPTWGFSTISIVPGSFLGPLCASCLMWSDTHCARGWLAGGRHPRPDNDRAKGGGAGSAAGNGAHQADGVR